MMLSLLGKPSDIDAFEFFLAVKLSCQVGDLDRMSVREFEQWQAYFESEGAFKSQKRVML